jgi:pyruvate formate lyase activating enzyme
MVFDIKKFSLHDGPGIRTTVFLKGCPLNCVWCHNPESLSPNQQIVFHSDRCIQCGDCVAVCPNNAISINQQSIIKTTTGCDYCGKCVEVCPANAWQLIGRKSTSEQIMEEVLRDVPFFEESGGGVTISGGEPLMQIGFLKSLLASCKQHGLHTAVDTCGFVNYENFETVLPLVDLFLYDLKIINSDKHRKFTSVDNTLIKSNLRRLIEDGKIVNVRIPIIPGVNDDDENILETIQYLKEIEFISEIDILPYHNIAASKYDRLGKEYALGQLPPPTPEEMQEIKLKFKARGYSVHIGG